MKITHFQMSKKWSLVATICGQYLARPHRHFIVLPPPPSTCPPVILQPRNSSQSYGRNFLLALNVIVSHFLDLNNKPMKGISYLSTRKHHATSPHKNSRNLRAQKITHPYYTKNHATKLKNSNCDKT